MSPSTHAAIVADLVKALEDVRSWAEQRCPCENEQPDPCPLCGEPVDGGACRAVDKTFPCGVGANIEAALTRAKQLDLDRVEQITMPIDGCGSVDVLIIPIRPTPEDANG